MNDTARGTLEYVNQLVKYGVAGFAAAAADIGMLYALTEYVGIYYLFSAALSFCLGVGVNYIISTRFVFTKHRLDDRGREFAIFFIIGVVGLVINVSLIGFLTEYLNAYYLHSKLVAVGVGFFFNFNARKFILF